MIRFLKRASTIEAAGETGPLLGAAVEVEIAAGKAGDTSGPPTFEAIPYTGAPMRLNGWRHPVIIDLNGIKAGSDQLPVLRGHDDNRIVGHVSEFTVNAQGVHVKGVISGSGPDAQEVVANFKNGYRWQLSQGSNPADLKAVEFLGPGRTAVVNGQNVEGPQYIVRRAIVNEISFLPRGADGRTSAAIAATSKGTEDMSETQTIDIATLKRIDATCDSLRGHIADEQITKLRAEAIDGTLPIEDLYERGFEALKKASKLRDIEASMDHTDLIAGGRGPAIHDATKLYSKPSDVLVAALMSRSGFAAAAEKDFGARVMQESRRYAGASLVDFGKACVRLSNQTLMANDVDSIIQAASLSMYSLPTLFMDSMNRIMEKTYADAPAAWRTFAAIREVKNFYPHKGVQPSAIPNLTQLPPGGEIHHGTLTEENVFEYRVHTYAQVLGIDRRDFVNDDLGFLTDIAPEQARAAMRTLTDLVMSVLLSITPDTDAPISVENVSAAIAAMLSRRDSLENNIDVAPAILLTTPEQRADGIVILESEEIAQADGEPTGNPNLKALSLAIDARLANDAKFANASTTWWGLLGAPFTKPLIVAFLNGKQAPTATFFPPGHEADNLFAHYRIVHDFGAASGDPNAVYISSGDGVEET